MDIEYWKNIFINPPSLICQQMKRLEILFILPNENTNFIIQPCVVSMQYYWLVSILHSFSILKINKNIIIDS